MDMWTRCLVRRIGSVSRVSTNTYRSDCPTIGKSNVGLLSVSGTRYFSNWRGAQRAPVVTSRSTHEHRYDKANEEPTKLLVSKPAKNEIKLRCTEFNHQGAVKTTAGEFLKSELCAQHGLQPRDLRKIDTHYVNQIPAILVREQAILVNLAHIRALVKADLVVLFDSYGSSETYNQSLFIYDLQERLRQSGSLPFEFRALEAILISVTSSLQTEIEMVTPSIQQLLSDLEEKITAKKLKELLRYSKKMSQFEKDVLRIRDAVEEVLEQDEDLAAMYLTAKKEGRPPSISQHSEIELLLESYLKQTEEIANLATTLLTNMKSTEDIVNIILDANRNELLLLELKLTMGTLGFGAGAFVVGIFGMNLASGLEHTPYVFWGVTGAATLLIGGIIKRSMHRMITVLKEQYR